MVVSRLVRFIGVVFMAVTMVMVVAVENCAAEGGLSTGQMDMFSQNNITFYDPSACVSVGGGGFSSSVCGDTPAQKYWSALRQHFDETHAAAIMGSIVNEGTFGVTRWEIGVNVTGDGGTFKIPWNTLYNNCTNTGKCGGVGAFGITWTLSPYLQYVNGKDPSLIQYFQNPSSYSFAGDKALDKIGEANFSKLVELEVNYVLQEAKVEDFQKTGDLNSAADWWTMNYENCKNCCGGADRDKSCEQIAVRRASAQKALGEFAGYSCGGASAASSGETSEGLSVAEVTSPGITLIGDSISVQSEKELSAKFPNGFLNKVGSRHSKGGKSVCPGDSDGVTVLNTLVSGSGTVVDQHWDGSCENVSVGSGLLAKNVVWELGTNSNGANENTIKEVIDLIGKDRNLFLVTPYNGQDINGSGAIADIYKKVAEDNSNVHIVDWRAAVENEPSKYVKTEPGMTVHPTDEGKKLLADLIYQVVTGQGMTGYEDCNASVTGTAGEAIAETAIRLAWPEGTDRSVYYGNSGVPEEFTKAAEKWGFDGWPSCSRFASMVILESGVDPDFESILPARGNRRNNLYTIENYIENSPNWKRVSYEERQPGDIIINHAHVEVYVGDDKKAHAGEIGSSSPADNFGPHIAPLSVKDKTEVNSFYDTSGYKWYRSTNDSGLVSLSGGGAGCNVCATSRSSGVGGLKDGGFESAEEADRAVMEAYRSLLGASASELSKYNIDISNHGILNCVAFTRYFLTKYTNIDMDVVPRGDGGAIAKRFYELYHDKYSDLKMSSTPTPYSIASCGAEVYHQGVHSHTFVVLGVNQSTDTMIIGEAGYNAGINWVRAKTKSLTSSADKTYNGADGYPCTFVDVSSYVTGV